MYIHICVYTRQDEQFSAEAPAVMLDELKRDVLEESAEAVHGQRAAEEVVRRLAAGERAPAEGDAEVEEDALAVEFKDEAAKLVGRYLKAEAGQGAGPTGYA